jgi:hypothetical protein
MIIMNSEIDGVKARNESERVIMNSKNGTDICSISKYETDGEWKK